MQMHQIPSKLPVAVILAILIVTAPPTVQSGERTESANRAFRSAPSAVGFQRMSPSDIFMAPVRDWHRVPGNSLDMRGENRENVQAVNHKPSVLAQPSPQAETVSNRPERRVAGTWREENGYVVINLNGQELQFAKESGSLTSAAVPSGDADDQPTIVRTALSIDESHQDEQAPSGGTVHGRLLHRGRSVSGCQVTLAPLKRAYGRYQIIKGTQPQTAVTAADGRYDFENVKPGPYKLFWLPKGEQQWVRRIEYQPDVVARNGEATRIKDIRTALRTLN
jgi:hypothetical protein